MPVRVYARAFSVLGVEGTVAQNLHHVGIVQICDGGPLDHTGAGNGHHAVFEAGSGRARSIDWIDHEQVRRLSATEGRIPGIFAVVRDGLPRVFQKYQEGLLGDTIQLEGRISARRRSDNLAALACGDYRGHGIPNGLGQVKEKLFCKYFTLALHALGTNGDRRQFFEIGGALFRRGLCTTLRGRFRFGSTLTG